MVPLSGEEVLGPASPEFLVQKMMTCDDLSGGQERKIASTPKTPIKMHHVHLKIP